RCACYRHRHRERGTNPKLPATRGRGAVLAWPRPRGPVRAKKAENTFNDAVNAAEAGHHDAIGARAWTHLFRVVSQQSRVQSAHELEGHALAAIERLKGDDSVLVELLMFRSFARSAEGHLAESIPYLQEALALCQKLPGPDSYDAARVLTGISNIRLLLGEYE